MTNHHCVEGYLQSISDEENNRWRDGFIAKSRAEEAPTGPAGRIWITQAQTDVTTEVMTGITKRTSDGQRADRLEANKKALVKSCEDAAKDRRCRVASFDGGSRYLLIERRQLDDLRVVWAPPRGVGQFGGDIDNWEWPRHGFDTALLRIYVAPDGSSAEYAEENVPYAPKHHLKMSPGLSNGDLTFVAGYPGRTSRNRLTSELAFDVNQGWGRLLEYVDRVMPILEKHAATSDDASARLGPSISGLANVQKNRKGVLEGIARSEGIAKMQAKEDQLITWMRADKKRKRKFEKIYNELTLAIEARRTASDEERWVSGIRWTSDLLSVASRAVRWAQERQKPDAERKPGYQDRDKTNIIRGFDRMERSLHLPSERELVAQAIGLYLEGEAHQRWPSMDNWLKDFKTPQEAVDALYGESPALADKAARTALLDLSLEELNAHQDPFVQLALALDVDAEPRREASEVRGARLQRLRREWSAAERAYAEDQGQLRSYDANSTLRVSFGRVRGYAPEDGLWANPFSSLKGLAAKAGDAPFDAPDHLVQAALAGPQSKWAAPVHPSPTPTGSTIKDGEWVTTHALMNDVPIDFLADLDTTGGNSGSPCFDAQGRLTGLLFDGVWESVANDYVYDDQTNRSIVADIRGLGWLLSQTEGADWIAAEMGLTR